MIEQTLIDLTAAVNRLADAYERANPGCTGTDAPAPPKKTRGKKVVSVDIGVPATVVDPKEGTFVIEDVVTEQEQLDASTPETTGVVTEQEPISEDLPAEPESPSVGAVPAPTHSEIKQHIKDYRRLQAHMLAARKINHQTMLRETLDKLGLDNIDACPDDRLPELWAAVQEITQEIE